MMRYVFVLSSLVMLSLCGCVAHAVTSAAYVDNKIYVTAIKAGGQKLDYFVAACNLEENGDLNCKKVQVKMK